ncbi:citrate lyase acyl carrier protein, partial [Oenococcus oeni]
MEIKKTALAGTTESSDIQITLSKGNDGIDVDLTSDVKKQFGDQIVKVITDTLNKFQITNAKVRA